MQTQLSPETTLLAITQTQEDCREEYTWPEGQLEGDGVADDVGDIVDVGVSLLVDEPLLESEELAENVGETVAESVALAEVEVEVVPDFVPVAEPDKVRVCVEVTVADLDTVEEGVDVMVTERVDETVGVTEVVLDVELD